MFLKIRNFIPITGIAAYSRLVAFLKKIFGEKYRGTPPLMDIAILQDCCKITA
jgi:hypothetical protein